MKPRRFFTGLLLGVLLGAGGWLGLIWYQWDVPVVPVSIPSKVEAVKMQIAQETPSPKIMIFAGSSAIFGLDAGLIGRALGQPAINMAVNLALTPEYHFHQIRQVAQSGDTVVLAYEYDHFLIHPLTDLLIQQAVTQDQTFFSGLSLLDKVRILTGVRLSDLWERADRKGKPVPPFTVPPEALQINSSGDNLNVSEKSPGYRDRVRLKSEIFSPDMSDPSRFDGHTVEVLKAMRAWCGAHDVKLLATFPSVYAHPALTNQGNRAFFKRMKQGYESAGIPVLGEPEDSMYDLPSMFENYWHIISEVRDSRTRNFIALLKPFLGKGEVSPADAHGFYEHDTFRGWTTGDASIPLSWNEKKLAQAIDVEFSALNPRRRQVEIWWNNDLLFQGNIQKQNWSQRLPLLHPVSPSSRGVLRIRNQTTSTLGQDRLPLGLRLSFVGLVETDSSRPLSLLHREDYRSTLTLRPVPQPLQLSAQRPVTLELEIKNRGEALWPDAGAVGVGKAVRVGIEWFTDKTKPPLFPGARVELPAPMPSGRTVKIPFSLLGPLDGSGKPYPPGHYEVRISLVHEGVVWFHDLGDDVLWLSVNVLP